MLTSFSCSKLKLTRKSSISDIKRYFNSLSNQQKKSSGDDAIVKHLSSTDGKEFVLKQIKHAEPVKQFLLIIEKTAADIGNACQIPISSLTFIIPQNWNHPSKEYPERAAILQTKVPGEVCECNILTDIHQHAREPLTAKAMDARYGSLQIGRIGLTHDVIQAISQHPDLAKLCAFDTFINNADRSPPNVFFNKATNSYYGIDHFSAFSQYDLASNAIMQLERLKEDQITFSETDIKGLKHYLQTLKLLAKKFSYEKIYKMILKNLDQIYPKKNELPQEIIQLLQYYKTAINTNCNDVDKLKSYIENILMTHRNNQSRRYQK